jgi:hypothetical protein
MLLHRQATLQKLTPTLPAIPAELIHLVTFMWHFAVILIDRNLMWQIKGNIPYLWDLSLLQRMLGSQPNCKLVVW